MLELRLLGRFEVGLGGAPILLPSRPAQSLLAYLALNAGTAHRREKLAGLFWPEAEEGNARSNLRHALWRIRKAIESDPAAAPYLLTDELAVSFNAGANYSLDAALLARTGDTLQDLQASVGVYQGELLPGFYDDWVTLERERFEALFQQKMQRLLDRLAEERHWPAVVDWSERWVALGHAPEPGYRALMLAHAELGDRGRVVGVYQRCREALFNDLGVEPSAATRRLYERLRRDDDVPPASVTPTGAAAVQDEPPAPGESPFQGLHYFDIAAANRFFGRETLIERLVGRLRTEPFVAVLGASGSGKSSIVRAGLVSGLRRFRPPTSGNGRSADALAGDVRVLTPTAHPLDALASTLLPSAVAGGTAAERIQLLEELSRDPHGLRRFVQLGRRGQSARRVVLIVDQFEEVFTLCDDAFEREAFVDNLLAAAADSDALTTLVIALRADFYAHCAQYARLREAVAQHQEYVGPMSGSELRRAIEGPAELGGWALEPGLINVLLRDVGEEPGALPLLSHALLETWQRRRGRRLTLAGYAESGGVQGAIAQSAETVLVGRLTSEQRPIARRIFLQLTELGDGTQDTRRRAPVADLARFPDEEPDIRAVLQILAEARLVTLDEQTAEVAHEALIREWPTLREWLNQDRESLRLQRQLMTAAQEWDRVGRDAGLLYRGVRLEQALEWTGEYPDELNALGRAFLDASLELTEGEAAEREAQRQREIDAVQTLAETQLRAASELRQRALLLAAAFVIAVVAAAAALFLGDQAQRNASTAQAAALTASARELAANAIANLDVDPQRSILLALRAVATTDPPMPEAEAALHRAVQASRTQLTLRGHTDHVESVAFSPDGGRLASSSNDATARVWDASTGQELLTLAGHSDEIDCIAYSPDGKLLATASWDHTGKIWDANTGAELLALVGHTDQLRSVAFSPDGQRLATASVDGTARVWDVRSGAALLTLTGHQRGLLVVVYSPDGTRLATGGLDGTARVWDVATGQELFALESLGEVAALTYSPDGRRIATGGSDNTVREWDASTGQELLTLTRQGGIYVQGAAYSPDGRYLAIADYSGNATVRDAETGEESFRLRGHALPILGIAYSPDGRRIGTASSDNTVRVWDATPTGQEVLTLSGHRATVFDVKFSPDGARMATASWDGTARIWDATTGLTLLTLGGHADAVWGVAFSPDGTRLATGSVDNTAKIWDAWTGEQLQALIGHGPPLVVQPRSGVTDVAFSPDGTRVATGGGDGTVRLWDASNGRELQVLRVGTATVGYGGGIDSVLFSPDGTRLAMGSEDRTAKLWDLSTGQEVREFSGHSLRVFRAVFSPDGTRLATSSSDGTAKLWDVATGQQIFTLVGHTGGVQVAYSPDGTRLATSAVGTARVWDAATGRELLSLVLPSGWGARVAFSPDGARLAVASTDTSVHVYLLHIADLVKLAHARLTRSWTAEECAQFLHLEQCPR